MKIKVNTLKKYFGFFLLAMAIYEIYLLIKEYKINKKNNNKSS
jgi:thiol:disulfide interchange protein